MSSVSEIYQQLCTEDRLPKPRQKDVMTALRYLAASHDATPDTLVLTPEVEASYKARLREYLTAQGKGRSTVRNSIQGVGQFLRALKQLPTHTIIEHAKDHPKLERLPGRRKEVFSKNSPYKHWSGFMASPYYLRMQEWPEDIQRQVEKYRQLRKDHLRAGTLRIQMQALEAYLGYLRMSGEQRLTYMVPESRAKLALKPYREDFDTIMSTPTTVAWNDLFVVNHIKSFVVWQSWRIHTPEDARIVERPPSRLSAKASMLVQTMLKLAQHLSRKREITPITTYLRHLPAPRKVHNKRAAYHQFTCEELEQTALTLMDEARAMFIAPAHWNAAKHPGALPASRFMCGLVLMLGWRTPLRVRNWSEAIYDADRLYEGNLRQVNGAWHWHFEGDELKVGKRNGETNIFDVELDPDVVPYLEEYLKVWRLKLPHADTDRHLLLSFHGPHGRIPPKSLYDKLRLNVFRLTGKRLYPHLLRTLFVSHAINNGMDLNSVAFHMNDKPETVLQAYNELNAQQHQQAGRVFFRRVLSNGHGTSP